MRITWWRDGPRPESVFLIAASFFGLVFAFVTPPFQVPDEYQHFDYAYALSIGKLFGHTSAKPRSIDNLAAMTTSLPSHPEAKIPYGDVWKYVYSPLNANDVVPTNYQGAGKYNPMPYVPVVIAIGIARLLQFSVFGLFFVGRLVNLSLWVFIGYWALKLLPEFKWAFLLIALTPMSLFQAASYSADAVTNALAFLWISTCLHCAAQDDATLSSRTRLLLLCTGSLVALTKPPYVVLLGLFFIIPRNAFGSRKDYLATAILLLSASFLLLAFSLAYLLTNDMSMAGTNHPVSFVGQLQFLLAEPLQFPTVVLHSVQDLRIPYWYSSIGLLGWLDVLLPRYVYVTYPIVLLVACLVDQERQVLFALWQKIICAAVVFSAVFAALLSVYLTWTPVGNRIIDAFQGRYLIPVMPVVPPLFKNRSLAVSRRWKENLVTGYVLVVLSLAARALVLRYYVG